ncbi:MAG: DUF928 domain-containing protein [Gallionella sp.]
MKTMKKILPWALALGMSNVVFAADFHPPMRGAPDLRVGGGSRAVTMQIAKINLYAPKSAGMTLTESPVLYWHLSKALSVPVEIQLLATGSDKPVLTVSMSTVAAGVHKFNLAEYGVKLQTAVEYRWQTTIIWDAALRTKDTVSSASIQYTLPASNTVTSSSRPRELVEQGFVYDGIAAISAQIEANPSNAALREERAALLEQIGQTEAAKADRK